MANVGPYQILIIAVLLIVLFGAKKLPDAARSLGRSMRIFKSEIQEMNKDNQQHPEQGNAESSHQEFQAAAQQDAQHSQRPQQGS